MRLSAVVGWHLMAHPPVEFRRPPRPDDGVRGPEDLSTGEVAAFLMAHPEVTTPSPRVQRCLAFLDGFRCEGRHGPERIFFCPELPHR